MQKRFFLDWSRLVRRELTPASTSKTQRLRGGEFASLTIRRCRAPTEAGPTLREVIWGVTGEADLEAAGASSRQPDLQEREGVFPAPTQTDRRRGFRVTRKRAVDASGTPANVWGHAARIDQPAAHLRRAGRSKSDTSSSSPIRWPRPPPSMSRSVFVCPTAIPGAAISCAARRAAATTISSCSRRPRPSAASIMWPSRSVTCMR